MKQPQFTDALAHANKRRAKITKRKNEEFGVFNWLMSRHIKKTLITEQKAEEILQKYASHLLPATKEAFGEEIFKQFDMTTFCSIISYDFTKFTTWFKENKNQL